VISKEWVICLSDLSIKFQLLVEYPAILTS